MKSYELVRTTQRPGRTAEPEHTRQGEGSELKLQSIERFIDFPPKSSRRFVIRPVLGPAEGIDITDSITRAIAQELWNRFGGNDVMNWIEAESLLHQALDSAARQRSKPGSHFQRERPEHILRKRRGKS